MWFRSNSVSFTVRPSLSLSRRQRVADYGRRLWAKAALKRGLYPDRGLLGVLV
jgi:hypothetical protein